MSDKTFFQIIVRLEKLFPDIPKEVGKVISYDKEEGVTVSYFLVVEDLIDLDCDSFDDLCNAASELIASKDPVFARCRMIHNRDWDKLWGNNGKK